MNLTSEIEHITRMSEMGIRKKQLPLLLQESHDKKINRSNAIVKEFVDILGLDNVFVSTSGGKDSACLSKLCKKLYPQIKHILFNTGLEYQATIELARKQGAEIIPPSKSWFQFCEKEGYPVGSKQVSKRIHDVRSGAISCAITFFSKNYGLSDKWLHFLSNDFVDFPISIKCCNEFKKKPSHSTGLNPIIGTRVQESTLRSSAWKKSGCNSYSMDYKHGISRPISLWTDEDIEKYIDDEHVELSEIYTQYQQKRTGCVNCPYGAHCNDDNRFDLLKKLEPKRYEYFMSTKLRKILALSNANIQSDPDYMDYKEKIQDRVEKWREENAGTDKYLTWKVRYALSIYTYDELIKGVKHISKYPLKYPVEDIMSKIQEINKKKGGKIVEVKTDRFTVMETKPLKIKRIIKKTKAIGFDNLKVGDVIRVATILRSVGNTAKGASRPVYFYVKVNDGQYIKTTRTYNTINVCLDCFELEALE